jgi:hypothetical protein
VKIFSRSPIRWIAVSLLATVFSPVSPVAAQEFEGMVRMRLIDVDVDRAEQLRNIQPAALLAMSMDSLLQLKGKDGSPAVSTSLRTYLIRDRKIRLESDQGDESAYTLIDLDRKIIKFVRPAEEVFHEVSIPELTRPLFPLLRTGGYMVRPLNQTRTINGLDVVGYEAVAGENVVRAWLTQQYPALTRLLEDLARSVFMPTATAEDRLLGLAQLGAPVLVQLVDMDGKRLDDYEVQEIIAVREQSVDSRLFEIPPEYRRLGGEPQN